jgi:hypothetical protein
MSRGTNSMMPVGGAKGGVDAALEADGAAVALDDAGEAHVGLLMSSMTAV